MNSWFDPFGFSMVGASLLLGIMGLWFTVIFPSLDHWSRRFFRSYYLIFILCCLSSIVEVVFQSLLVSREIFYLLLFLESLLLSLLLPMLTVFLLHCCGESLRSSKLLHTVIGLFAIQFVLFVSSAFIDGFFYVTPANAYYRGPLYPFFLLPSLSILLLNLTGTIKRKKSLSRKAFGACFVALLPVTVSIIALLFVDVFQLVDLSVALSALAMYSFILSDQIEKDRRHQQEIVLQQQEIVRQQQEIAQKQASILVLRMRPHFIYNTLMSIYSLCRLDPLKARQITMDFTNYLRKNFNAVASDSAIPFSEELEHTRAYLEVEMAQYEDMLAVEYNIAVSNFHLPPLTLQPIVENAVKHGMNQYHVPLHISIQTQQTDSGIEVTVKDNGRGFDPDKAAAPGSTLENIRQRLEMMCNGSLTITQGESGGTVAKITIQNVPGGQA